jgi:hypothetical protein
MMHRVKPIVVRLTMLAILSLAFAEIAVKVATLTVMPAGLYYGSISLMLLGLLVLTLGVLRRCSAPRHECLGMFKESLVGRR